MTGRRFIGVLGLVLLLGTSVPAFEINTALMHCTYQIFGPSDEPNELTAGTVFVMGVPEVNQPGTGQSVLVTASHVLEEIKGEEATIYLREKTPDGQYVRRTYTLQIRQGDVPLWVRHPEVDVALMNVDLPDFVSRQAEEIPFLSTDLLADDALLEKLEIHPGDELLSLGYPLGLGANDAGFPILRRGTIASYPLVPASETKSFLFDFEVFPGNSGGPVYFVDRDRIYGGAIHLGQTVCFVAGVIIEQHEQLRLAIVAPAQFIKETLTLLEERQASQDSPACSAIPQHP